MGCGCPMCPSHQGMKLRASLMAAALFAVVASPQLFGVVQNLLGGLVRVTSGGVPTLPGLLLHAAVYGLIVYLLMHRKQRCGASGELRRYPYGSY